MESLSKISAILETARDLTLEAAQSAGSSSRTGRTGALKPLPPAQLSKLLDSRNDREILEGLRKVISMMYRSQPSQRYFSSVIKNIASPNIEIKKLVYIYLLHHAEAEPDMALLSINTIQKSLTDQNPQVRAMAIRVMSGIRVPVISQIVSLAIKRGAGDMSPYVRKAAALAIPKCYRLDPVTLPQLVEYLSTLVGDKQYYVVGAAVQAFLDVCPERIDLIHRHYRSLLRKLVDMDEWSQMATLKLLTSYSRQCFPRRTRRVKKHGGAGNFYGDDASEKEEESIEEVAVLDSDLELLLKSIRPLLQSRNAGVVVAVARCFLYLASAAQIEVVVGPMISLLRSPQDIQHIALYNLVTLALAYPLPLVRYATHFLVQTTDPEYIWRLKMEILTIIFPHCAPNAKALILSELEHFARDHTDKEMVKESVRAIGRCAQISSPDVSARCLRLLLKQISSDDGTLVAESLTVIRHLIQQNPSQHTNTVILLAKNLDTARNPAARASIIWLVGEFSGLGGEDNIAPDVLRILVKGFADESETAKLQIVLLAAKVYLHYLNRSQSLTAATSAAATGGEFEADFLRTRTRPTKVHPIQALYEHILHLSRYDISYDLRDRARVYKALLSLPSSTQLASLLLLAPKPVPHAPSPSEGRKGLTLGSTSLVLGERMHGYWDVPDWVLEGSEPDPRLRDELGTTSHEDNRARPAGEMLDTAVGKQVANAAPSPGPGGSANGLGGAVTSTKEKTLDDWLQEDEEEEADSSEEDETEEEDEEDGEDDDDDDDDEESEDENEGDALVAKR